MLGTEVKRGRGRPKRATPLAVVVLRIEPDLKAWATAAAARRSTSLNAYLAALVQSERTLGRRRVDRR